MNVIVTNNLTKIHRGKAIADGINLTVKKGDIFGLLGPNGAGKTTLLKLLSGLIAPTDGEIVLFDRPLVAGDPQSLRRIGALIETPHLHAALTATQNLEMHCRYLGYNQPGCIQSALQMVGLDPHNSQKVGAFSLGMKQRLGVAQALIQKPELLLLDEPVNGLDPAGMKQMRELFLSLSQQYGITIVLSSHLLSQLERCADTVGIMQQGKLIEQTTMDDIYRKTTYCYLLDTPMPERAAAVLSDVLQLRNFKAVGEFSIRIYDCDVPQQQILKQLALQDVTITSFQVEHDTLESYFLNQTEKGDIND